MITRSLTDSVLRQRDAQMGYTLKKKRTGYSGDNLGSCMLVKDGVIEVGERFDLSLEEIDKFLNE